MATPNILEAFNTALWMADSGGTNFTVIGAINQITHDQPAEVAEAKVRDNASPYAPPTMFRRVTSLDSQISGEGYYDKTQYESLQAVFAARAVRQWRVAVNGAKTEQGAYIISKLSTNNNDATSTSFGSMSIELTLANGSVSITNTP